MQNLFSHALSETISKHIELSFSRRETLSWLVFLILRQGTICLWRLAAHVATAAQTESVRRRFYRFFQFVALDGATAARIVVDLLGLRGKPWTLTIDRTNWNFGKATINILLVSVIWNGMGIPLIWVLLPRTGNSSTKARTDLLDRLCRAFPNLRIASLMGDREFIGNAWMAYLARKKIPFILRLKENQHIVRPGYAPQTVAAIARNLPRGQKMILKQRCRLGLAGGSVDIRLVVMRLKTGELLALACSGKPQRALAAYRRRWTIETLFANLKTRGFSMEGTHITDRDKLATLLALLAFAVALAVKTGAAAAQIKPIPLKKHGRKACSIFALGLNALRKIFAAASLQQIIDFLRQILSPKSPLKTLKNTPFSAGV
jgi:hypothetical protein